MKKNFISLLTFIVSILLGISCYATGNSSSGGSISQIELTDYVIIAGAIIFLIGLTLILLSLFLNTSSKKDVDEEYDNYFGDINIQDDDIAYEDKAFEDIAQETIVNDTEDAINEAEEVSAEIDEEEISETEESEEEPVKETEEEPINDTTEEAPVYDVPLEDEIPEPVYEVKSIRLTLSGINNSDLKMVSISDSVTAGRRSTNDLLISDSAVSGEHCKFTYDGEALFIEDLNSTNGTFLNGEQIEKAELKSGDKIILGQNQYRITLS